MKKFGRRTVLQLNDAKTEKKEKPVGLSGLVQYGNDYSESEEEEELSEAAATPPVMPSSPAPAEQNGQSTKPEVKKNGQDMDTQLADFLAEIESISKDDAGSDGAEASPQVETAPADSTSATPHTSRQITPVTSSGESETDEEEEPPPDVEKPKEPKTLWQHCLDEGTQHYYYWNTVSNQVTWEIPEDYSKYLLLLKEYEERLAKYEKVMKEWEERKKEPKKRKKKSKGVANGTTSPTGLNDYPKPLVDYKIETPDIKPNVELVTNKYGRGLGFTEEEGKMTPYVPRHRATFPVNFVKGETVTNKLPELIPKVSKSEPSATQSRSSKEDRLSPVPPQVQSKEPRKESIKSDSEEESGDQEKEVAQGPQLPTFPATSISSTNKSSKGAESRPESDMELEDFDLDDIDRQLELALEKKLDGKTKKKRQLEDNTKEDNDTVKKLRSDDCSLPTRPLQPRPPAQPPADKVDKKKSVEEDIKIRAEVTELASNINDKLDCLEVSRKSMTQLQILLIETETRISDWREGGIESGFMLKKLQDAAKQIKRYELSAAPPGWSCHWDRTYKRYYYFHNTTGESSWEYPEDEVKDTVTSSQVPAPPSHNPGQHLAHSTMQGPPLPGAPPMSRDQPIHFAGLTAAPPPPPPPQPAPPHQGPYPDSTASTSAAGYVLPPGLTNPPPPPSTSPPPPPPGTAPSKHDAAGGQQGEVDKQEVMSDTAEDADENVISAAPQIRQNIDLDDGQSLDGVPTSDQPDGDVDELPSHSSAPPAPSSNSQSSASALPELSSAGNAAKEKKKKKKLGTGLAMKKKGVGNLVQKWQQIQEEVATKQKD